MESDKLIGYFYYRYSVAYVRTGRDLKRMESNTRSPIYASFGELLDGIVTVRYVSTWLPYQLLIKSFSAYSAEQRFFDILHCKVSLASCSRVL